ncbi:hypothetical protein ZHAS_00010329 [Anopheles sinensis]|uniref:Uncharacterized protein n=1 Tax=Anopheles sinensis TaxID=74873 RepID=A0A084VXB5_ANOSI|nr:hypothetical protein ZHAS_00010329 [Anopheles sinensis]
MEMILAILRKKAPQFDMPKHPRTLVNTNRKATGIHDATNRASKAAMLIEEEANVEPETESIVKVAKKRRSVCFQNLSPTESSIGKLVMHQNLGNWAIENIYKRLKSVMVSPDVEPHCETSKTCPLR